MSDNSLSVLPVPAFADNYLWLIHDGTNAAIVDPGDAAPVLAALDALGLSLVAILLTHHHADHVGGVPTLLRRFPGIPVFAPASETIRDVSTPLAEGDTATVPQLGLSLSVLDVPGHTRGHIAYVDHHRHWLFCGDTLFAGGCGRLFEGTPAQMVESLSKFTRLPDATQVFCAHEYTIANLRFALAAEPENPALIQRMRDEQAKRDRDQPTLPSSIGLEKATNPFLRYQEPAIVDRLVANKKLVSREPIATFAALREWKNSF